VHGKIYKRASLFIRPVREIQTNASVRLSFIGVGHLSATSSRVSTLGNPTDIYFSNFATK
jgi:hypothetical protein